ncbi:DUF2628 domain-containing protein [Clostridium sp.]|uniref:DUF2628 domain-containing protein n=1 Tax=Clostridium sp. TaxID=1506 RepID=UPI0025C65656|nr:DUF2628 domain-containing protein [Clostridium sp.]
MSEKKCPSCGASIDLNATECKYCGEAMSANTQQYQSPQGQPGNNYNQNNYATNEYTNMKLYYQQDFEKISSSETYKGKFNWAAFFFSWIWGLTKGLWALSIISIVIVAILGAMDLSWIGIVMAIIWGVRGNYCYYNLIKNKTQIPSKF